MKRQKKVRLPNLHAKQQLIADATQRYRVVCCGRRFGKSALCTILSLATALRGGRAWWLVPTYKTGEPAFRELQTLAAQIEGAKINRSDRLITLPTGGTVQVRTTEDYNVLRGDSLDFVTFDEAAFIPALMTIWLDVIRPALIDRQGRAMFISTPNGRNDFWQLYQYGLDDEKADWESFHFDSYANPHVPHAELDSLRDEMPDAKFRQEILAEFIDGEGVFRNVSELATASPLAGPIDGHQYTCGIDWGRSNDFTVCCIYDVTAARVAFYDRFSNIEFNQQLARIEKTIRLFEPTRTTVELNSIGTPLFEQMQRMKLPTKLNGFNMSNSSKAELVDTLALALERREIELLNDAALTAELLAYEAQRTSTGLTRYTHPSGGHDDIVTALMLAYGPNAGSGPLRRKRTTSWARM